MITRQPQDVEVEVGASVTFRVEATGEDLSYAWFQIDSQGNEQQWGGGENQLSFEAVDRWNAGSYFVRVSNPGGSVDSDTAALTLLSKGLCTAADLESVREDPSADYRLTCDIDLTGETFVPIEYVSGDFDGAGHTISGWVYDGTGEDLSVGLFRDVYGSVRNLEVKDFDLRGDRSVGAVAGQNSGWITDCVATDVHIEAGNSGGGLVGSMSDGFIVQSHASGSVQAADGAGGVLGAMNGTAVVSHSSAQVTVAAGTSGTAGGLVGTQSDGVVANCFAAGSVEGMAAAGGLVGGLFSGRIIHSYASAEVDVSSMQSGGLVGYLWAAPEAVQACYWDTERSRVATGMAGTGLTTTALQTATRFDGWDAASWAFVAGEDPSIAVHALPNIVSSNLTQLDPLGGENLVLNVDNILPGATVFAAYRYVCQPDSIEIDEDTLRCTTVASSRDSAELRVINPDLHRTAAIHLQYKVNERLDLFAGGTGSVDDPWMINTADQFVALHAAAGRDPITQHYALGADIDLDGVVMERFLGYRFGEEFSLDGAGHEIRNFVFTAQRGPYGVEPRYESAALFTEIASGAVIKNLDLRDFDVRGGQTATLVGNMLGTLSHIQVRDSMVTGLGGASGVSVSIDGNADHITVDGVELSGGYSAAGVTESLRGTISDCTIDIVSDSQALAGVVGYSIMAGDNSSSRIERSAVNAIHTGTSVFGGLLSEQGYGTDVVVADSYAVGSSVADLQGGIVGTVYASDHMIEILRCYSAVEATGTNGGYAGGIAGNVSEGTLIATASHWDTDVGPVDAVGSPTPPTIEAIGHSTSAMQMETTFTDWDFTNVSLPPSGDYPTLRISND